MQAPKTGLKANKGRSYREIEHVAGRWRLDLGYQPSDPFDALSLFDKQLGDITISCLSGNIDLCEHLEPCQEEGLTRWDSDGERLELVLSEDSYASLQNGIGRARFTTCHEFAHAVLHTDELVKLAGLTITRQAAMYRQREHKKYFDSEWQANAFAAAILMPAEGVRWLENKYGYAGEDLISDHFATSLQAARYRLESMAKV